VQEVAVLAADAPDLPDGVVRTVRGLEAQVPTDEDAVIRATLARVIPPPRRRIEDRAAGGRRALLHERGEGGRAERFSELLELLAPDPLGPELLARPGTGILREQIRMLRLVLRRKAEMAPSLLLEEVAEQVGLGGRAAR